jgi:hypothetical protein
MYKDIHNNVKASRVLGPVSITSSTTTVGQIIDMKAFGALEFIIAAGSLNAGSFTPKIEHSDNSDLSGGVDVPAAELIGTIAEATFADTDDNAVKKIGYRGIKRYVRLSIVSAGASGANLIGAVAVQGLPEIAAVA